MEIVRVLRILEYVGPRDVVEQTLAGGGVPAIGEGGPGGSNLIIKSAIVGLFPEVVKKEEEVKPRTLMSEAPWWAKVPCNYCSEKSLYLCDYCCSLVCGADLCEAAHNEYHESIAEDELAEGND